MKTYWGSGGIPPCILNIGTTWSSVVSFKPGTLYPRVKASGGPKSRSGREGEEKKIPSMLPPGIEPRSFIPSYTTLRACPVCHKWW